MSDRPLPVADAVTAPFWEAARNRVLKIQQCPVCEFYVHYPRELCPRCLQGRPLFVPMSGRGRVYSYTIMHSPGRVPGFDDAIPFACALVELDEQAGLRLVTNVVGCDASEVFIGAPVKVTFEEIGEGVVLPQFELDQAAVAGEAATTSERRS
jgi:uncharacterized protein